MKKHNNKIQIKIVIIMKMILENGNMKSFKMIQNNLKK